MLIPSAGWTMYPTQAVPHSFDVALSNSFGFGGINATLMMRRWNGNRDGSLVRETKTARMPNGCAPFLFVGDECGQIN